MKIRTISIAASLSLTVRDQLEIEAPSARPRMSEVPTAVPSLNDATPNSGVASPSPRVET